MLSRILSTLVLWAVILAGLYWFGPHAAVVMVTALAALTLYEFYGLTEKMGARPFKWMGLGFSVLITAAPFYLSYFADKFNPDDQVGARPIADLCLQLFLVLALVISCVRVLRERDTGNRMETIGATVLGLLYVPFMLQFLVRILMRDSDSGDNLTLCLWVVAVSKFCDVGALLTGLAFGKHKMAPVISPKKTWEGAVGGVLVSAGVGATIAYFFASRLPEDLTPLLAAAIAVPLAIITIVSDLMESALKRRADIMDTGKLVPGIGGAFDLTDSLILTAPVAYFIFLFLP